MAIKVLPEDLVHDRVRRDRLLQEARAASTLEHPNIGVIHEVGEADGMTFIAMELIRGEKLSQTLGRGPLLLTRALDLTIEIAGTNGRRTQSVFCVAPRRQACAGEARCGAPRRCAKDVLDETAARCAYGD